MASNLFKQSGGASTSDSCCGEVATAGRRQRLAPSAARTGPWLDNAWDRLPAYDDLWAGTDVSETKTGRPTGDQLLLRRKIEQNLPAGLRLWRMLFYQMPTGDKPLQFVVLRAGVPEDRGAEIEAWRDALEQELRVGILIQKERVSEGITRQLTQLADADGLIRSVAAINNLIASSFGRPPRGRPLRRAVRVRRQQRGCVDLTATPFITIDPAGARDLDDALWAERRPGGGYRLLAAFADVTQVVTPGSRWDYYARRLGFSLYGRLSSVPLLGEELGYRRLSLQPQQNRRCFVVELELGAAGEIEQQRLLRAVVRSHQRLTFAALSSGRLPPVVPPVLTALQEAAGLLRGRRLDQAGLLKVKPEGDRYIVVEEAMLAAKAAIADIFQRAGVPLLYKVHAPLNRPQRKELIRRLKERGFRSGARDFADPRRFRRLLSRLQEAGAFDLFYQILDAYLKRACYSLENRGHHGLGLPAYTEIKGLRNYVGILNQRQAAHLLSAEAPVPPAELRQQARRLNRKHRIYHDNIIRLLTFEDLRERLEFCGQPLAAVVAKRDAAGIFIAVPGFRQLGFVPMAALPPQLHYQRGDEIVVSLTGYNPRTRQYLFTGGAE